MGNIKLKPADFVHLHNHTHYSLLDGLTKVPKLVERVKKTGMEAVAITDHGTLSGSIEFYKSANAAGIKPIVGMEAYIAPRTYLDKDPAHDRQYFHLTMLAMNHIGYQNLMRLATLASLEGFYYKPRIDHDLIKKHSDGVIVLSGCIGGEVSDALRADQYDQAKKTAEWYKEVFGDRYYIELQDHGHPDNPYKWDEQERVNGLLLKLADELSLPAVVTCDAHYLEHEDQEAHEVLLCVQTGSFLTDEGRMSLKNFDLHVIEPKVIISRWGEKYPELIRNTKLIADRCNLEIKTGDILIPKFPVGQGNTEKTLLEKMVWQGLVWRYGGVERQETLELKPDDAKKQLSPQVVERAEYELSVVDSMGFNGYYLIVQDFINWGKDKGIIFGPGRGSAASSVLAYALRITEIDPLKYDLLFERFLNPDRISMPDMDIDIQDTRRDEVIEYCVEKYGRERVANIVTFGSMAARNSVRDVARVLQVPYAEADRLSKMIPPPVQGRHTPLAQHLKKVPELINENQTNETSAKVFRLAMKLEGTIRSHGVHAAGVVIAPDDVVDYAPLEVAQKGAIATQYSMGPIEDLGLLKMDFLGLSNLTTIKNALRIVKRVEDKNVDIEKIPLDDEKTFDLLRRGETTGVFQLESSGMRRYLKDLKPTDFEDIIAMVALYRPGPLTAGLTDKFIERKNGREPVTYDHHLMEKALATTYGVIVYQEQVMQIVKDMCGFSGGESDTLRKAVGKKQRETMAKMKDQVIKGAMANQVDKAVAEKFWKDLEGFADYAFNKSHAACYGLIAYQTAYLKANWPLAFMAALMSSDYDNTDRLALEINECKNMGIKVLPPDVNESFHEFAVVPGESQIRFGMDAIKNVGHGPVDEILRAREAAGGSFSSLEEFCTQVSVSIANRKTMESLIKSGALDRFGDRAQLLGSLDTIMAFAQRAQKQAASGQVDLFGNAVSGEAPMVYQLELSSSYPQYMPAEQLAWERELLGLYLSAHPLEEHTEKLSTHTKPIVELKESMMGQQVTVGGSVTEFREITTKKGQKMAFAKLADMSSEIEIVVFPGVYESSVSQWQRDNVIIIVGKIGSGRDNGPGGDLKVLADQVYHIDSYSGAVSPVPRPVENVPYVAPKPGIPKLYIRVEDSSNQSLLLELKSKLDAYTGNTEVVLVTGEDNSKQVIKLPQSIEVNETSLRDLAGVFGATNVVVK